MSIVPSWPSDGVDSFPSLNQLSSPPKDYRMIIKAKRSLPSNRLPPPTSYSHSEQISSEIDRGDDVATIRTQQKKSRSFSGYNTESYSANNYATKMAQNILDRVKQELRKIFIFFDFIYSKIFIFVI